MTTSHDSAAWPMDVPAPGPALNTTFLVFTVRVRLHFVLALMVTINSISSSDPSLPDAGATAVPSFGRLEVATPIAFNAFKLVGKLAADTTQRGSTPRFRYSGKKLPKLKLGLFTPTSLMHTPRLVQLPR